jgi:hypothetical protein
MTAVTVPAAAAATIAATATTIATTVAATTAVMAGTVVCAVNGVRMLSPVLHFCIFSPDISQAGTGLSMSESIDLEQKIYFLSDSLYCILI